MPRYDFKCRICFAITEAIAPRDQAAIICPVCNPPNTIILAMADRQVSAPAHIQVH